MNDNATIYCDESGNDGPNYLNPQQPFYVLAGWVVPDNRRDEATAAIRRFHQSICRDADELKFKTFKKSEGKRESLIDLICELGDLGLIPVYLFAEKRYCVAAKIVETFLDPHYNPCVRNGLTWDVQTKQELANTLYEVLPEAILQSFARAYQNPTKEGLDAALSEVVKECRGRVNSELAEFMEGSRKEIAAIAAAEMVAAGTFEKAAGTLNFPCLVTFMMLIEQLARQKLINPHRLVHDEQGPYQVGYSQIFEVHRDAADYWVTLAGQDVPYGAIRSIKSFEIEKSINEPLIQAADLLAGAINHICTKLQAEEQLTAMEKKLANLTLPLMLVDKIRVSWPICSDQMLRKIGKLFGELSGKAIIGAMVSDKDYSPSPLPIFPVTKSPIDNSRKFPVTLPLYAVVRSSDGEILIELPPGAEANESEPEQRIVPVFTDESVGLRYLREKEANSDVPIKLRRFDVNETMELLNQLDARAEHAFWIGFNPIKRRGGCMPLREFVSNMRKIFDRTLRAIRSGAADKLLQEHVIDGRKATSLLLSSGEYGAAWKDDDKQVYKGVTRDEALAALQSIRV